MARLEFKPYDGPSGSVDGIDEREPVAKRQAEVTLSRRNLLALLHKLDMPGSARRLENTCVFMDDGEHTTDLILVLRCEDDEEHYADERRLGSRPGIMHPDTESFIQGRE